MILDSGLLFGATLYIIHILIMTLVKYYAKEPNIRSRKLVRDGAALAQ